MEPGNTERHKCKLTFRGGYPFRLSFWLALSDRTLPMKVFRPVGKRPSNGAKKSSAIATRLFPFALCPKTGNMSSDSFQKKDLINEWRLDNPPPCQRGKSLNLWVYGQR